MKYDRFQQAKEFRDTRRRLLHKQIVRRFWRKPISEVYRAGYIIEFVDSA